jgi:eukaryotic-like serine/threonine-protein kinase
MNKPLPQPDDASPTVDELAEEFLKRRRSGEVPDIEVYATQYPDMAEDIREVFPALMAMESLKRDWEKAAHNAETNSSVPVERLGDYRLLHEIGRGGMGIVYEAVQESLDRHVALKLLPQHAVTDATYVRRLQREARTAAALHHSNIVPVFGVGQEQGYHYIVMQLIPGAPLDRVIRLLREPGGESLAHSISSQPDTAIAEGALGMLIESAQATPITEPAGSVLSGLVSAPGNSLRTTSWQNKEAASEHVETSALQTPTSSDRPASAPDSPGYWRLVARLGSQIASALEHAHGRGTLHRDIKPGNILLDLQGAVWVTDFGLAHATDGSNATQTGSLAGTLSYMAPEQFDGKSDERSDVYSLGLTLYELATLRPAIPSGTRAETVARATEASPPRPRSINPNIPADLQTIILKAISQDPAHRYQSAAALAEDLCNFEEDRPIKARRVSAFERFRRWCRRNPWLAMSTSGCVLLLVLATLAAVLGYAHESQQRQKMQSMLTILVDSLEHVYDRFIPEQISAPSLLISSEDETQPSVLSGKAALSPEAAAMLEELLPAFDKLAQQFNDDDSLKANAAQANRRVADIHVQLGNYDRAIAAYREAIRRYTALPDAKQWLVQIAVAHNEIGNTLLQQGNKTGSTAAHRDAIELLLTDVPVVEGRSDTSKLLHEQRFELARSWFLLGKRGRRDQLGPPVPNSGPPEGEFSDRRGPQRLPPGRLSGPGRPGRMPAGGPEGRPHMGMGRADEHERHRWLQLAIDELNHLIQQQDLPEYSYLLAMCLRDRSHTLDSADSEAAIAVLLELTEAHPTIARYRYELSRTYGAVRITGLSGTTQESAMKRLRQSIEHMNILMKQHPDITAYAISAAHTNHLMSMLLMESVHAASEFERELLASEATIHAATALSLQRQAMRSSSTGPTEAFWLMRFAEVGSEAFMMDHKPILAASVLQEAERQLVERRSGDLAGDDAEQYDRAIRALRRRMQEKRPGPPR